MNNQDEMWKQLMTRAQKQKQPQNLTSAQATTKAVQAQMPNLQTMNTQQAQQAQQVNQSMQAKQATQVPKAYASPQAVTPQSTALTANQQAYNELLKQSQYAPQLSQQDQFKKWWNENAGVGEFDDSKGYHRTDAMDDTTYRIGQNMYDGYLQKQDLLTEYQAQQERLNREKYQQEANANYQKWLMEKYLPDVLNKNGYSGNLGLVRDANLGIDNDYLKSVSNINENYNDTMQNLTSDYNSNVRAINESVSNKNDVLYDKQQTKNEQSQDEWYTNLQDTISTTMAQENPNYDEIYKYLETNKNRISQDRYEQLLDSIERSEKETTDPFSGNNLEKVLGGSVKIATPQGGNYYVVDSNGIGGAKLSELLPQNELKKVGKKGYKSWDEINRATTQQMQKMGYSSTIDSNIKNGTTIHIGLKRGDNSGYYVTYINGLWYRTEKV